MGPHDPLDVFLEDLRRRELEAVLPFFPPAGARVLELGAGPGVQAKILQEAGYRVSALDLPGNPFPNPAFSVQSYDGEKIPFPDGAFDVVFSSHTLEHAVKLESLLREVRRVLAPSGRAVHVLPTAAWRTWSSVTHYHWFLRRLGQLLFRGRVSGGGAAGGAAAPSFGARLRRALFPPRHGERGNFLSETFLFSRRRWLEIFRSQGWTVSACRPLGIFYTGTSAAGPSLGWRARRVLARALGSASAVYVMSPEGAA